MKMRRKEIPKSRKESLDPKIRDLMLLKMIEWECSGGGTAHPDVMGSQ